MSDDKRTLKDAGTYLLFDKFDSDSAKKIVEWILTANLNIDNNGFDHLHLIINSPGGSATALFSIIDTIWGSKIPVRTTGLGMIASCGFMLFIAGEKGHRVLTPNTSVLSHQYAWGSAGKHHELLADRVEQDRTLERALALYKKCLPDLSEETIMEKLLPPSDVWLSAQECLELGICDSIYDDGKYITKKTTTKKKRK